MKSFRSQNYPLWVGSYFVYFESPIRVPPYSQTERLVLARLRSNRAEKATKTGHEFSIRAELVPITELIHARFSYILLGLIAFHPFLPRVRIDRQNTIDSTSRLSCMTDLFSSTIYPAPGISSRPYREFALKISADRDLICRRGA